MNLDFLAIISAFGIGTIVSAIIQYFASNTNTRKNLMLKNRYDAYNKLVDYNLIKWEEAEVEFDDSKNKHIHRLDQFSKKMAELANIGATIALVATTKTRRAYWEYYEAEKEVLKFDLEQGDKPRPLKSSKKRRELMEAEENAYFELVNCMRRDLEVDTLPTRFSI